MNSEPEPNPSDKDGGKAILIAYLFLVLLFSLMQIVGAYSQGTAVIQGQVTDEQGQALIGALIRIKGSTHGTSTGKEGEFSLPNASLSDTLIVSYLGFHNKEVVPSNSKLPLSVVLQPNATALHEVEVVSTGYQDIPKERATGSFAQPVKEMFEARVATDVLSRLNGITSGLVFNANTGNTIRGELDLSIRGRSTIFANDQPLIVVDNFVYNGDMNSLNPQDIESVTVLKDAAAASIWGVKAGNGVIVITTKKGKVNQPIQVSFNSNVTVSDKPNLFYNPLFLTSADYLEVEQFLFRNGRYNANLNNRIGYPAVSPAVEIMALARSGAITRADSASQMDALKGIDVRDEQLRHFYRHTLNQQYGLNISGGGERSAYYLSLGYDKNLRGLEGNDTKRTTVNFQNVFSPHKRVKINSGIYYVQGINNVNATLSSFTGVSSTYFPYTRFADDEGNPLAAVRSYRQSFVETAPSRGFLNWAYYPLTENGLADNSSRSIDARITSSLEYTVLPFLKAEVKYQYQRYHVAGRNRQDRESFQVRNTVNQYSILTGGRVSGYNVPPGDILSLSASEAVSNNLRMQLHYNRDWASHSVTALAGYETNETRGESDNSIFYGYNDAFGTSVPVNNVSFFTLSPSGSGVIPSGLSLSGTLDRFRSTFANVAYTYLSRYTFSASGRVDGSNYFGVRTNQKSVPLWSAGARWDLDKEAFYNINWLPSLKLNLTYGYNGNLDRTVTGISTFQYFNAASWTNLPYASLTNIGNPDLRWEKAGQLKIGLDFASRGNRVHGTIDYYHKTGRDLIGSEMVAPSSGLTTYKGNFSDMKGKGVDVSLVTQNTRGAFDWGTTFQYSYSTDRVTHYSVESTALQYVNADGVRGKTVIPVVGRPVFSLYSYQWAGLDPQTGDPRGYVGEEISKDYTRLTTGAKLEDLVYHGSARPTSWGGITNRLGYKNCMLLFTLSYKLGYYFRRNAIHYTNMFASFSGVHREYSERWQQPGDEQITNVPSMIYPANTNRDQFYNASEVLVERGDHVRLQDISLAYTFQKPNLGAVDFKSITVFLYANNIGILWKKNKAGLDPDAPSGIPPIRTISAGLKANF